MDLQTEMALDNRFDEVAEGLLDLTSDEWRSMRLEDQTQFAQAMALTQIARKLEHILLRMSNVQ
jgi:hypothetical protein